MGYEHRNITLIERVQRKFALNENTHCWEWTGKLDNLGYGNLSFHGKGIKAHRASWIAHKGPIPDGMHVLHKCDVRHCINPDHLFLGTHQDNMRDRDSKNRLNHVKGVKHPHAKLNPEKAFEIRWLAALGWYQRKLAKEYGVTQRAIAQIIHNKTWIPECHD